MKIVINHEKGWTLYTRDGKGASPQVRHHLSGQISLVAPSNRENRVTLNSAAEIFFTLSVLKQVKETGLGKVFKEREDDLTIAYTTADGLTVRHRKTPSKQFHCATPESLDFVIEALEHITTLST